MTNEGPSEYETRVVRIFPDYADTVIWFSGAVDYEETGLSGDLVARLDGWEGLYYRSLDGDRNWRSLDAMRLFDEEGLTLAREVAAEIGPDFEVEYSTFEEPSVVTRLTADKPATNPAARDAFAAMAHARDLWDSLRRARETDPTASFGWFAYPPIRRDQSDRPLEINDSSATVADEGE